MATQPLINIQVRGVDELQAFLATVPHGTKKLAIEEITKYLKGDTSHGLMHYPPYVYTGNKAKHKPPIRTYKLRRGWNIAGGDYRKRIINNVPYAPYVVGDNTQSYYLQRSRWRTVSKNIADNMKGAMLRANQAIQRWLKAKEK